MSTTAGLILPSTHAQSGPRPSPCACVLRAAQEHRSGQRTLVWKATLNWRVIVQLTLVEHHRNSMTCSFEGEQTCQVHHLLANHHC